MLKMNMFIKIFTFMQNICKKTVKEKVFIQFFSANCSRERKGKMGGLIHKFYKFSYSFA